MEVSMEWAINGTYGILGGTLFITSIYAACLIKKILNQFLKYIESFEKNVLTINSFKSDLVNLQQTINTNDVLYRKLMEDASEKNVESINSLGANISNSFKEIKSSMANLQKIINTNEGLSRKLMENISDKDVKSITNLNSELTKYLEEIKSILEKANQIISDSSKERIIAFEHFKSLGKEIHATLNEAVKIDLP
jgi:hypothetical protein